jgi:ribosomal protein L11 methyltransferase
VKKKYINVKLSILEENQDIAIALISDFPFIGISQFNDEIVVCFNATEWNENLKNAMIECLTPLKEAKILEEEFVEDMNWNEEWEKNVPIIRVSDKIGITPSWKKEELDTEIKIIIDPKMSFGTGEHATTRLVSILMDGLVKPNSYWMDAGTGTGVLAILSILLGARSCYAFDNNEWSIDNSRDNIKLNGVSDKIEIQEIDIETDELPDVDSIAANIFTHLIIKSMPKFAKSLQISKGDLVCSGILKYDKDIVVESAINNGFELVKDIIEDEWIAFHFRKK